MRYEKYPTMQNLNQWDADILAATLQLSSEQPSSCSEEDGSIADETSFEFLWIQHSFEFKDLHSWSLA